MVNNIFAKASQEHTGDSISIDRGQQDKETVTWKNVSEPYFSGEGRISPDRSWFRNSNA
jgi:hypothetical protein